MSLRLSPAPLFSLPPDVAGDIAGVRRVTRWGFGGSRAVWSFPFPWGGFGPLADLRSANLLPRGGRCTRLRPQSVLRWSAKVRTDRALQHRGASPHYMTGLAAAITAIAAVDPLARHSGVPSKHL